MLCLILKVEKEENWKRLFDVNSNFLGLVAKIYIRRNSIKEDVEISFLYFIYPEKRAEIKIKNYTKFSQV